MKVLIDLGLFLFGALVGVICNWAIYQLRLYSRPAVSPWGPKHPQASPRTSWDYLPIFGWLSLRRDAAVLGTGFWIRPLLIELGLAIGAVLMFRWCLDGGLTGVPPKPGDAEVWIAAFGLLFALLTIATFIDFDEQTIPDWITIPGTLAGLAFAALAPGSRLPVSTAGLVASYEPIHFMSPHSMDSAEWRFDWRGLAVACGILMIWSVSLMPMLVDPRRKLWDRTKFMLASVCRPPRRTACSLRVRKRRPRAATILLLLMGVVLCGLVGAIWYSAGTRWDCVLGAVLGLGFGGGMVWAVRLIGSAALGQEAMGFGDVTLMAMIGAFLGWQAALLVFGLAPFAAIAIALTQFLLTRNRAIAFGPYLALGAVLLVLFWKPLWEYARTGFFQLPHGFLMTILGGALIAMAVMLLGLRMTRGPIEETTE